MTNGATPPGAKVSSAWSCAPRSLGADVPKRRMPPAPAATSACTAATLRSSTGTTIVCSASRSSGQLASTSPAEHCEGVGVAWTIGVGDADGVAGTVGSGLASVGTGDTPAGGVVQRLGDAAMNCPDESAGALASGWAQPVKRTIATAGSQRTIAIRTSSLWRLRDLVPRLDLSRRSP